MPHSSFFVLVKAIATKSQADSNNNDDSSALYSCASSSLSGSPPSMLVSAALSSQSSSSQRSPLPAIPDWRKDPELLSFLANMPRETDAEMKSENPFVRMAYYQNVINQRQRLQSMVFHAKQRAIDALAPVYDQEVSVVKEDYNPVYELPLMSMDVQDDAYLPWYLRRCESSDAVSSPPPSTRKHLVNVLKSTTGAAKSALFRMTPRHANSKANVSDTIADDNEGWVIPEWLKLWKDRFPPDQWEDLLKIYRRPLLPSSQT